MASLLESLEVTPDTNDGQKLRITVLGTTLSRKHHLRSTGEVHTFTFFKPVLSVLHMSE
jgi:hypothetical protein